MPLLRQTSLRSSHLPTRYFERITKYARSCIARAGSLFYHVVASHRRRFRHNVAFCRPAPPSLTNLFSLATRITWRHLDTPRRDSDMDAPSRIIRTSSFRTPGMRATFALSTPSCRWTGTLLKGISKKAFGTWMASDMGRLVFSRGFFFLFLPSRAALAGPPHVPVISWLLLLYDFTAGFLEPVPR